MSDELGEAIEAARDLAWRSTANYGSKAAVRYAERKEAHEQLIKTLGRTQVTDYRVSDTELRYLVDAMRRVAACTFSNRQGLPYYERKQAVKELRGCLVAYDYAVAHKDVHGLSTRIGHFSTRLSTRAPRERDASAVPQRATNDEDGSTSGVRT